MSHTCDVAFHNQLQGADILQQHGPGDARHNRGSHFERLLASKTEAATAQVFGHPMADVESAVGAVVLETHVDLAFEPGSDPAVMGVAGC